MKLKVLEETPIGGAPSVWVELGVTYAPMGLAAQTHRETREEYVASPPMAWLCE